MSAPLIAANRLNADVAGLTGPRNMIPTAAAPSQTEAVSSVLIGEHGSLGYLFDNLYVTPVSTDVRAYDRPGPHGGAGHPDAAGAQVLGVLPTTHGGLVGRVIVPSNTGPQTAVSPLGQRSPIPPSPTPGEQNRAGTGPPSLVDRGRQMASRAGEAIADLFTGANG